MHDLQIVSLALLLVAGEAGARAVTLSETLFACVAHNNFYHYHCRHSIQHHAHLPIPVVICPELLVRLSDLFCCIRLVLADPALDSTWRAPIAQVVVTTLLPSAKTSLGIVVLNEFL